MKNTIKVFVLVALTLAAMSVSAQVKLGHIETQKLIRLCRNGLPLKRLSKRNRKK